jgi:hypothetical protein
MLGQWTSTQFDPKRYFGFTYLITCIPTGKMYVGKKNFRNKNGKESNWKNYTSSSKELNSDIEKLGKDQLKGSRRSYSTLYQSAGYTCFAKL